MSGNASTEMMTCPGCNTRVLLSDMRSYKGQTICKACFELEKEEAARKEKESSKKSQLRLRGQEGKLAQVWVCPDDSYPICGFCESKTVFFAGKPSGDPAAAATALRNGDDPRTVLLGSPFVLPVSGIYSAYAPGSQPGMMLAIGAPPSLVEARLVFADVRQRNLCFAELGKALGNDYTVQSKLATDWSEVSRLPFILAGVALVLTVLVFWAGLGRADGASPGALQDLIWKFGGAQLGLFGVFGLGLVVLLGLGAWAAWEVKEARGAPTEMRLVRRGTTPAK